MRRVPPLICMAFISWIALMVMSAAEGGGAGVAGLSERRHDRDGEQRKD